MRTSELRRSGLTQRSPGRFAAHGIVHLCAILLLGAVALRLDGVWAIAPFVLASYTLMYLFAPFHECTHRNAFNSVSLNRLTAWGIGLAICRPAECYREFHLAHHRHTNDPAADPELAGGPITHRPQLLWAMTGIPLAAGVVSATVCAAIGRPPPYVREGSRQRVVFEARIMLSAYAVIAVVSATSTTLRPLALAWILAVVVGLPLLQFALLAEHTTCPFTASPVADSRTTLIGGVARFVNWNASYHSAHHAHPTVPYFRLPALHDALGSSVTEVADSYPAAYRTISRRLGAGA